MHLWERIWAATTLEAFAALWAERGPFSDDLCKAVDARLNDLSTRRCRMCVLPARITSRPLAYCGGYACHNDERVCQRCGAMFARRADGATGKYCSEPCQPGTSPSLVAHSCARCGKRGRSSDRLWPYVCDECRYPIRLAIAQLRDHHVPWDLVLRLFDDPGCAICHRDILGATVRTGSGRARSALVVDHDHACCPGGKSCGRCVRGFLCGGCNTGIGLFSENAAVIRAAADYLDRWRDG